MFWNYYKITLSKKSFYVNTSKHTGEKIFFGNKSIHLKTCLCKLYLCVHRKVWNYISKKIVTYFSSIPFIEQNRSFTLWQTPFDKYFWNTDSYSLTNSPLTDAARASFYGGGHWGRWSDLHTVTWSAMIESRSEPRQFDTSPGS